jgi:hypothetical protein
MLVEGDVQATTDRVSPVFANVSRGDHSKRIRLGRSSGGASQATNRKWPCRTGTPVLLPFIADQSYRRALGGLISKAQDPAVLLFELAPRQAAPTPAHIWFPLIGSAHEDIVHQVVRARLEGQRRTVVAVGGYRSANEDRAWGSLGDYRLLESEKLIHSSGEYGRVFARVPQCSQM